MGNTCKKAETPDVRKKKFLLVARYSLPVHVLIQANGITKEKIQEFRKVFNSLGNQTSLEASKLGDALKALSHQYTEEELSKLCLNGDITDDDRLSFDLFVKIVIGFIRRADPEVEMKEAFRVFDLDGDGRIVADEIRKCLKWNDSEIAKFIRDADKDGDGMIDYNEFIRLLVECDDKQDFN